MTGALGEGRCSPRDVSVTSAEADGHVLAEFSSDNPFVRYARTAAVAFLLVAVYTLIAKVPGGEIRDDWLHTVLHGATGIVAASLGWAAHSVAAARAFTMGIGLAYGALGIGGWFTDGLFLDWEFAVPLTAADNVFHLLLAGGASVAGGVAWHRRSNSV